MDGRRQVQQQELRWIRLALGPRVGISDLLPLGLGHQQTPSRTRGGGHLFGFLFFSCSCNGLQGFERLTSRCDLLL